MKTSPLHLCRYFVTKLNCSANPKFDAKKPVQLALAQLSVDTNIKKVSSEVPERVGWSIDLTLSYQPAPEENYPYTYSIQLVGFFTSPAQVPEGLDDERLVRVNGSSMLYGTAREMLRSTTAAGPWGEILIPTVSFYEAERPKVADAKS